MPAQIVPATITSLMASHGLGATAGQRMLFGGCSAGAIGAMNNLETVAAMLPPTVQLRGFFDGAALLDIKPRGWEWSPDLETLQSLIAEMLSVAKPVFPSYCATLFGSNLWKCLVGQYRMPLITTVPFFSNMPQFDMVRRAAARLRMLFVLTPSALVRSSTSCTTRTTTCP